MPMIRLKAGKLRKEYAGIGWVDPGMEIGTSQEISDLLVGDDFEFVPYVKASATAPVRMPMPAPPPVSGKTPEPPRQARKEKE